MSLAFIVLWMIFFHIVDDYYLQGWLASAKQRSWWVENAPQDLYKHDYVWALLVHSFSWSFMIMLPIAYKMSFAVDSLFVWALLANMMCHAVIDNTKANDKSINLIIDQLVHLIQILITALIFKGDI